MLLLVAFVKDRFYKAKEQDFFRQRRRKKMSLDVLGFCCLHLVLPF